METISVIIPTLNRPWSVLRLLESIRAGVVLPTEVIIIEQGDVQKLQQELSTTTFPFPIRVFYNDIKALTAARNRGVREASGEILCFLDDDMTVARDYLQEAQGYFKTHENVVGLSGAIQHDNIFSVKKCIGMLFLLYGQGKRNIVLCSGAYDYVRGKNLEREVVAEWLFGGNMVFRAHIFKEYPFAFNEKFIRWGFGEDALLTYQINKKYEKGLRILPQLRVVHHGVLDAKITRESEIRMMVIYRYIFWKTEVYPICHLAILPYFWSQIGIILLFFKNAGTIRILPNIISTYVYLIKNKNAIVRDEVDFNSFIFS